MFFVEQFMMSYSEKPEDITREEWMEKLNNVHIQRADMNRLIMNYLVTGTVKHTYHELPGDRYSTVYHAHTQT